MPIENVYDRFSFKFLIQATLENFGTHNRASTCSKIIGLEKYQTVRNQLQKKSTWVYLDVQVLIHGVEGPADTEIVFQLYNNVFSD